jgi:hypothetical protein
VVNSICKNLSWFKNNFGYEHPNTKTAGNNYIYLLEDMGKSEEEIQNILSTLL